MVKLTKIYTRGGDKGKTSLGSGKRVAKHDGRVAAYGTVDEANAAIGLARLHTATLPAESGIDAALARIQNEMFDLGADLCTPISDDEQPGTALRIVSSQVMQLESDIDRLNANLGALTSFILPAGTAAAAHLHMARTIVRRAERDMTAMAERETVNPEALAYINRLSDLLFVMTRVANQYGPGDVLWQPGATRG